jgi:hypothetical protein
VLNPEWVVVMRSSGVFLALTCFLDIPARVRGFYPGGVHIGAQSAPVLVLLDMMDMLEQVYGEVVT